MVGKNSGARPGAGRPKGSYTRPQLRDALTHEQIDALVRKAHDMAEQGDTTMLKFILEQVYGKAPQQLEVAGPDGEPLAANLSASDRRAIDSLRDILRQRAA